MKYLLIVLSIFTTVFYGQGMLHHSPIEPNCVGCLLSLLRANKTFVAYKLLQKFDSQVDISACQPGGSTLMHYYVAHQFQENFMTLLLSKRANLEVLNSKGYTCLMKALMRDNYNAARMLANAGANTNVLFPRTQRTPLHVLCENQRFLQEVEGLLCRGQSDHPSLQFLKKLFLPASPLSLKELIVKKHCNLLLQPQIFKKLVAELQVEVLHALLQQTMIFDDRYLSLIENVEILQLFQYKIEQKSGSDLPVNKKDWVGNTPLHLLAKNIYHRVAFFLVCNGADRLIKNNEGLVPCDVPGDLLRFHRPVQGCLSQPQEVLKKIDVIIKRKLAEKNESKYSLPGI